VHKRCTTAIHPAGFGLSTNQKLNGLQAVLVRIAQNRKNCKSYNLSAGWTWLHEKDCPVETSADSLNWGPGSNKEEVANRCAVRVHVIISSRRPCCPTVLHIGPPIRGSLRRVPPARPRHFSQRLRGLLGPAAATRRLPPVRAAPYRTQPPCARPRQPRNPRARPSGPHPFPRVLNRSHPPRPRALAVDQLPY